MQVKIKICGLMSSADVQMCASYGADILGFVVDYPHPVAWNLDAASAKKLISAAPKSAKTCIVTTGTPENILDLALYTAPDYVQLHGRETVEDTALIACKIRKHGIMVIKTVYPDMQAEHAVEFSAAGVHALLLDSRTPGNATTGGKIDFAFYNKLKSAAAIPIILAGGINPENVREIVERTKTEHIDLMSGVESTPGRKDEKKLSALFHALGIGKGLSV